MKKLLCEMEAYAQEYNVPIIKAEAADILLREAMEKKPLHILEVGTAIGYSALRMAECLGEGGRITTIELSDERADLAEAYIARSPYADAITVLRGDAAEVLPTLADTYDFIFIDVLFRGYVMDEQCEVPRRFRTIVNRLRQFLAMLDEKPQYEVMVYPEGDGIAICKYKKI